MQFNGWNTLNPGSYRQLPCIASLTYASIEATLRLANSEFEDARDLTNQSLTCLSNTTCDPNRLAPFTFLSAKINYQEEPNQWRDAISLAMQAIEQYGPHPGFSYERSHIHRWIEMVRAGQAYENEVIDVKHKNPERSHSQSR